MLAGAGTLFVAAALIQPYNTERPYLHEQSRRVRRDHLSLAERLGYATLLRGGYGTVHMATAMEGAPVTDSIAPDKDVVLRFETNDEHPDWRCIANPPPVLVGDKRQVRTPELTVALVAAERYNRDALQRRLERWAARMSQRMRDRLPDYSLGVAQIRPSTARRLLTAELDGFAVPDSELLELLVDDCINVRLASQYVHTLAQSLAPDAPSPDSLVYRTALMYNGADATPTINGLRYADAVWGAYQLLTRVGGDEESAASGEGEDVMTSCIYFPVGSVTTAEDSLTLLDLQEYEDANLGSARVQVRLVMEESGPPSYLSRLEARRQEWIEGQLARLGMRRDSINFMPRERLPQTPCNAGERTRLTSAALVFTGMPAPTSPPPTAAPPPSVPQLPAPRPGTGGGVEEYEEEG